MVVVVVVASLLWPRPSLTLHTSTTWLLVGTTTLASVILWAANTLQFQGACAGVVPRPLALCSVPRSLSLSVSLCHCAHGPVVVVVH
jgi:hypothetical protein